jgi:DNA-binding CsgD family transcriptional regulator
MTIRSRVLPAHLREAGVTRREAEVLAALTDRLTNAEIAARLFISVRTVESHVSSLLAKLGVGDRTALGTVGRTLVVGPAVSGRLPLSVLEATERGPFVGRGEELSLLRSCWDEAAGGRRRIAVLLGEAGIGKSRLVAELATVADLAGASVVIGHGDQEHLVAYQPVVEALSALVETMPRHLLADALYRSGGRELARLIPALAPFDTRAPPEQPTASDLARYRLFESVAALVTAASQQSPLVVILEDLHWADPATLQLIKHLMLRVGRARLLVVATARGAQLQGALLECVDDLRRSQSCLVIPMVGLEVTDILSLLSSRDLPAHLHAGTRRDLATKLHQDTGGNPLFLVEVLHNLETTGSLAGPGPGPAGPGSAATGVPPMVRDLIVRRMQGLSDIARHVLAIAAVVGRRFDVDVVADVAELSADRLETAMEEAQTAELVHELGARAGWLQFSHALVRETVEAELSSTRKRRLHRLVGEALEADEHPNHLPELAYHFRAAASSDDHERAVRYAIDAAEQATQLMAHEQASELYLWALEAASMAPAVDLDRHFELLMLRTAAEQRAGSSKRAAATALDAAAIAIQLGDPLRIADAALAVGAAAPVWATDRKLIEVLEHALERIGDRDPARRARMLARLAQAEYYSSTHEHRRELSRDAVAAARAAGDDAALASVLSSRHVALWGPSDTLERLEVAEQILTVAKRLDSDELLLQGLTWKLVDLLELGQIAGADEVIAAHARLARDLGQPLHIRDAALWATMRALLDGRFSDAERESQRAFDLSLRAQDPHAEMYHWIHRYWLVLEQDASVSDLTDLLGVSVELAARFPQVPAWQAKIALLHARLGDREAATDMAAELSGERFARLPRDAVWVGALSYLAEVTYFLHDREQAAVLYGLLLPFADRVIVIDRALLCLGSVSRVLGLLAAVLGYRSHAAGYLRSAIETHDQMGARPLAARTRLELAKVHRGQPTSDTEQHELLAAARTTASKLGMTRLLAQVDHV